MSRKGENIFKRKDGRWEARYIHHYENGVAKYRYLYAESYTAVKKKRLAEQSKNLTFCNKLTGKSFSFKELADEWLESIKCRVKESTYTRYYRIVRDYLEPNLPLRSLSVLPTSEVHAIFNRFLESGGKRQKGLAPKTVSDIFGVFRQIVKYGNENKALQLNLMSFKYPAHSKKPVTVLESEKLSALEKILMKFEDPMCLGLLITLFSGIRIGELCGLKWGDINFKSKTFAVERTIERIADLDGGSAKKTKVIINTPKTENSFRVIPLQSFLAQILKKYKAPNNCYVLTGTTAHTEPHQYYVRYKNFLKRNKLGNYTFHALRHTFATRCVESGFDAKALSEILGHANVNTTLSVYIHPSMQQKKVLMEKLMPTSIS